MDDLEKEKVYHGFLQGSSLDKVGVQVDGWINKLQIEVHMGTIALNSVNTSNVGMTQCTENGDFLGD